MRKRMHFPIAEQGHWLGSVLSGFFAYHAVPTNYARIDAFRFHIVRAWLRTLRRRGQTRPATWEKMQRYVARYLPKARVCTHGRNNASASDTQGGSRMPEIGPYGSVRGAVSNDRPYRDWCPSGKILNRMGHL